MLATNFGNLNVENLYSIYVYFKKIRIHKLFYVFQNEDDNDDEETLNFPFLRDVHSIEFIKNSKVMFIMRGLPGSGKSVIARQIKQVYGDLAVICSADDFRVNDQGEYVWRSEEYETTHMKCRDKARQSCEHGIPVVVIGGLMIQFNFNQFTGIYTYFSYLMFSQLQCDYSDQCHLSEFFANWPLAF